MFAVKVEYANQVVREFIAEHGVELLPHKIVQVCNKYQASPLTKITNKDRILVGLRYNEFLAEDDYNEEHLFHAQNFAQKICEKHGIDFVWLMEEMRSLGWH